MKSSNPPVSIGGFTLCCNSNIPLMPHSTVLYHSIPLLRTPMFQCTSSRFSNFLVAQWQCLPCKVWVNLFFKKRFPWQVGDKLEEKALTRPKNYVWKYLFLSCIWKTVCTLCLSGWEFHSKPVFFFNIFSGDLYF